MQLILVAKCADCRPGTFGMQVSTVRRHHAAKAPRLVGHRRRLFALAGLVPRQDYPHTCAEGIRDPAVLEELKMKLVEMCK